MSAAASCTRLRAATRVEVADGARVRANAGGVGDELVDPEAAQPLGLGRVLDEPEAGAARVSSTRCSTGTSYVMSWAPAVVERRRAALVAAVGAQPLVLPARGERGRVGGVVDDDEEAATQEVRGPARASRRRRSGPAAGCPAPGRGTGDTPVGVGCSSGGAGTSTSTNGRRRRGRRAPPCHPPAARSTMRNGRLSSSSLASTTPSTGAARAARPSDVDDAARRPATGTRRLVGLARAAPGRARRSTGSSASSSRCAARSAGRALDQHVAQRGERTPAPPAARRPRAGPGPRPPRRRRTGRAAPSPSHQLSSARATSAPNSVPTSGLVTKSRPIRPAPPPPVKNPSSLVVEGGSTNASNGIGPSPPDHVLQLFWSRTLVVYRVLVPKQRGQRGTASSPMRANSCG